MEQKQWDHRRHSVKVEETPEIHLPTGHSAERILPSKDSESCWEGGIILALMWGEKCGDFQSLSSHGILKTLNGEGGGIRENFKIQFFKKKFIIALQMRFPNYTHWFNDPSLKSTLKITVLLLRY